MNNKRLCALVAISVTVSLFAMNLAGNALGDTGTGAGSRDGSGYIEGRVWEETTSEKLSGAKVLDVNAGTVAYTDKDGNFNISVPVGDVELLFTHDGDKEKYKNATLEENGTTLDIGLVVLHPLPGNVEGVVVDSATNEPVQGAEVQIDQYPFDYGKQVTGKDGSFRFDGVEVGTIYLKINCEKYEYLRVEEEIENGETLDVGNVEIVRIPDSLLIQRGDFTVRAVDEDDIPIGGAVAKIEGEGISNTLTTDPEGKAHFPQIPEGKYNVTLTKDGFKTKNRGPITVKANEDLTFTFIMEKNSSPASPTSSLTTGPGLIGLVAMILVIVIAGVVLAVVFARRKAIPTAKPPSQAYIAPQPPQYGSTQGNTAQPAYQYPAQYQAQYPAQGTPQYQAPAPSQQYTQEYPPTGPGQ